MKYTLSVLVENQPGVLSKVVSLFARRGYNIDSLAVGTTEDPTMSRMTIVGQGDDHILEQVEKQLNKESMVTLKYAGEHERCETLLDLLRPYGIREIARTGVIALERG